MANAPQAMGNGEDADALATALTVCASVWAEVLGIPPPEPTDGERLPTMCMCVCAFLREMLRCADFVLLGGDSLSALAVVKKLVVRTSVEATTVAPTTAATSGVRSSAVRTTVVRSVVAATAPTAVRTARAVRIAAAAAAAVSRRQPAASLRLPAGDAA